MRDKLYQTRERSRHLLAQETSEIPEEATYTSVEQVLFLYFLDCHLKHDFHNEVLGPVNKEYSLVISSSLTLGPLSYHVTDNKLACMP